MSWSVSTISASLSKVSQIDRPSSGLQDLIRTPTGKDYGYGQNDRPRNNDLPAASPEMHGVHDRSTRGGMITIID